MNKLPWFTHDHNAHQDLWMREMIRKYGHEVHTLYWTVLELIHLHGKSGVLVISKMDLANALCMHHSRVTNLLTNPALKVKVNAEYADGKFTLRNEKFIERQRDLKSKAVRMQFESSSNAVRDIEGEREVHNNNAKQALRAPELEVKNEQRKPRTQRIKNNNESVMAVITRWLELTGRADSEIAKQPGGWGRWKISSDRLLSALGGRLDLALECLDERAVEWSKLGDWTIDRVASRAIDWISKKQAEHG